MRSTRQVSQEGQAMNAPSLYARFEGGWCDNCRTAFPYTPRDGNCPGCGPVRLRPATITVEPHDADEVADAAARARRIDPLTVRDSTRQSPMEQQ